MLFRVWNCYQVYLRRDQSGKGPCLTWVESDVCLWICNATEVLTAPGSLDFVCCQRLGCHLDNTCLQDVAWILADFQKLVNNSFCLFLYREEINAGTLRLWEETGPVGQRPEVWGSVCYMLGILVSHSRGGVKKKLDMNRGCWMDNLIECPS